MNFINHAVVESEDYWLKFTSLKSMKMGPCKSPKNARINMLIRISFEGINDRPRKKTFQPLCFLIGLMALEFEAIEIHKSVYTVSSLACKWHYVRFNQSFNEISMRDNLIWLFDSRKITVVLRQIVYINVENQFVIYHRHLKFGRYSAASHYRR